MKMRLQLTVLGVLALFVAASCEEWLNVTSNSQIRSESQFQTEMGFKDALMGVYVGMTEPAAYGKDMTWYLVDILSQQYNTLPEQASYSEVQQYAYESFEVLPKISAMWDHAYNSIARVNNILGYVDEKRDVFDPINYDIIKGELLALRAFLHFDMIRLYGYGNLDDREELMSELTIPYVTEYTKQITPQRSYRETFNLMLSDLDEALELLETDPYYKNDDRPARPEDFYDIVNEGGFYTNREKRLNYYAALALQARILAWLGGPENMDLARQAAEEVIQDSPAFLINPDTYPVTQDPILYPEILFGLNVSDFDNLINTYLDASNPTTNAKAVYLTDSMTEEVYETDNLNVGAPDIRFNTLMDDQLEGFVPVKLFQDEDYLHPDIMPLIKLPEMYYIAAEYYADYDPANLSKAIDYLNTVRTSRGIVEAIPAGATAAEVSDEIFKEYRKEFVSEGQLFFFYKRLGVQTIPGYSHTVVAGDDIYKLPYPDAELEFRN